MTGNQLIAAALQGTSDSRNQYAGFGDTCNKLLHGLVISDLIGIFGVWVKFIELDSIHFA